MLLRISIFSKELLDKTSNMEINISNLQINVSFNALSWQMPMIL